MSTVVRMTVPGSTSAPASFSLQIAPFSDADGMVRDSRSTLGYAFDGPCNGQALEPVALTVIDGDVCLCGVKLLADDRRADLFEDSGETIDVMIHPD